MAKLIGRPVFQVTRHATGKNDRRVHVLTCVAQGVITKRRAQSDAHEVFIQSVCDSLRGWVPTADVGTLDDFHHHRKKTWYLRK